MIRVEDFSCLTHIEPFLCPCVPRQLDHCVQIIAQQRGLLRIGRLLCHAAHFLEELFLDLVVQMQLSDLLAVYIRVIVVGVLAKLLADGAELLAQIVVTLALVNALLHLLRNFVFKAQDLKLLLHQRRGMLQPPHGMQLLKQLLLVLIGKGRMLTDDVRNEAGVVRSEHLQQRLLNVSADQLAELLKLAVRIAHERVGAGRAARDRHIRKLRHTSKQVRLTLYHIDQLRAHAALDKNTHILARHTQELLDLGNGADVIEIPHIRIVRLHILLRNEEDPLVLTQRFLDSQHRFFAADVKMRHHARKHAKPAQRQDRQAGNGSLIIHNFVSFPGEITQKGSKCSPFVSNRSS